jgi:hypothetical protein
MNYAVVIFKPCPTQCILQWPQKDENLSGPMEWHHPQSPRKKKFKTTPSAGKVMVTVFWDTDGVILVDVMARGETINSDAYIKTLQNLKTALPATAA